MIFFISDFFIADLYNFLQASRSTKFCMFFNTKAQCAHTCVVVLSPYLVTIQLHKCVHIVLLPDGQIFYDIVYV